MRAWAWLAVLSRAFSFLYLAPASVLSDIITFFLPHPYINLFCSCFVYLPTSAVILLRTFVLLSGFLFCCFSLSFKPEGHLDG